MLTQIEGERFYCNECHIHFAGLLSARDHDEVCKAPKFQFDSDGVVIGVIVEGVFYKAKIPSPAYP